MTRRRIALACAVAGLTVFGANLGIYAIEERFYNYCLPDPYGFSDPCPAQKWTAFGITIACWLVPTYLVARREAIGPFACALMGSMVWLGIVAFVTLAVVIHPSQNSASFEAWATLRVGLIGVPLIGLLTAGVGYTMQAVIRTHRRKQLSPPEPLPPPPAPTKEERPAWQRWLFMVAAVAATAFLTYVVGLVVNDSPSVNDTPMAISVSSDGCFNAEAFDAYNEQAVVAFEEFGTASRSGDITGMIDALYDARRAWVMINGLVDEGVYPELQFHTDLIVKSLTWAVDAITVVGEPTAGEMNKAAMLISSAGREMNALGNTMESNPPTKAC